MKYDLQLLLLFLALGLWSKKLTWRGWFGVGLTVFVWIMYSWKRG